MESTENLPLTISIVTPSYNQGQYLEEAIRSVLNQDYQPLEYVIIDGGSTDNSVEIIKKYADQLAYWVSEPDEGMYDAINKGFAKTTGEIMAWINSDDMYTPWAFKVVAEIFATLPEINWITTCFPISWGGNGQSVCNYVPGYTKDGFYNGENLSRRSLFATKFIQQESTFWRRSLWDRAGGYLDTSYSLAADFELWARFYKYTDLVGVKTPLGGFRVHPDQQTASARDVYIDQAKRALRHHGGITSSVLGALIRRISIKFIPHRFGRFVVPSLGMLYPGKTCRYDVRQNQWVVEAVFI